MELPKNRAGRTATAKMCHSVGDGRRKSYNFQKIRSYLEIQVAFED